MVLSTFCSNHPPRVSSRLLFATALCTVETSGRHDANLSSGNACLLFRMELRLLLIYTLYAGKEIHLGNICQLVVSIYIYLVYS